MIAKQLYLDGKTSKTGDFWEQWIKPNIKPADIDNKNPDNPDGLTGSARRLGGNPFCTRILRFNSKFDIRVLGEE